MKKERLTLTSMLLGVIVLCGCTSSQEKLYEACEYYNTHGYEVMSSTEHFKDGDKRFLLVRKNDTIYLDTKFKKNGISAIKVFPNENGINFRTLEVSFDDKITGKMIPIEIESNFEGFDIVFHDKKDPIGKDLLISWTYNPKVYYYLGDKYALVLRSKNKMGQSSFTQEETFTFADLYKDEDDSYRMVTLNDYPFIIEENFSLDSLSFSGFSPTMRLNKNNYPWQQIKDKTRQSGQITEDDEYLYVPISWIGTNYMDVIKECVDHDIDEKEADLIREQIRERERAEMEAREREKAEMIEYIENNAIDFTDMKTDYSRNPIMAEKKYTIGADIILKIRIDKIEYSYSDYTYVMSWLGLGSFTTRVYVYSNDKDFAELDYPQIVWIKTKYSSRHEAWDNIVTYKFMDAQLLLWKKPGLLE